MKRNIGALDRSIRIALAAIIAILIAMGILTGTWALVLGICAGLLVITALLGVCVMYSVFRISTVKNTEKQADGDTRGA